MYVDMCFTAVAWRASCTQGAPLCDDSWQAVCAQWCPLPWEVQQFPAESTAFLSHQERRKRLIPEEKRRDKLMSEIKLISHFIAYTVCFVI